TQLVEDARTRIFFLDYAPVLVASALSGESVDKLFRLIANVGRAAEQRIGTGVLNRLLRAAFAANPPPMVSGRRLKLFYAAQSSGKEDRSALRPRGSRFVEPAGSPSSFDSLASSERTAFVEGAARQRRVRRELQPAEFVLFVNEPRLLSETYRRYLEARIRKAQPYPGLPLLLTCRPRQEKRRK